MTIGSWRTCLLRCTLVVFPSRYEGFGIPVLEAMAAHRPIVLSDIPVFRELTEDKGAYFPPDDSEAMAALSADLLSNVDDTQKSSSLTEMERVRRLRFPSSPRRSSRFIASSLTLGAERCPAAISLRPP